VTTVRNQHVLSYKDCTYLRVHVHTYIPLRHNHAVRATYSGRPVSSSKVQTYVGSQREKNAGTLPERDSNSCFHSTRAQHWHSATAGNSYQFITNKRFIYRNTVSCETTSINLPYIGLNYWNNTLGSGPYRTNICTLTPIQIRIYISVCTRISEAFLLWHFAFDSAI
jgi:hypothetical protein